jgi:hypothetical protein
MTERAAAFDFSSGFFSLASDFAFSSGFWLLASGLPFAGSVPRMARP